MSNDLSKEYNDFFHETYKLFFEITRYTILLENLGGGKVEVTSINELRGVLYHLYAFNDDPQSEKYKPLQENYIEAKEHLYRAYYDVFSMLSLFFITEIQNYAETYSVEAISKVYPDYFKKILPELAEIVEKIANIRTIRKGNAKINSVDNVTNDGMITILLSWHKTLKAITPNLSSCKAAEDEAKVKAAQKEKKELILKWVIPFITLFIGIFLKYLFDK